MVQRWLSSAEGDVSMPSVFRWMLRLKVDSIHCIPGNAGTARLATNHACDMSVETLVKLFTHVGADLVVVGPEAPLCDSLADACRDAAVPCFGPVAALAHLEGSKLHAKQTMEIAGVPTAAYQRLDASSDLDAALDAYAGAPWVVKRDVLAGGKGVVVTENREEAKSFIERSIQTDGFVLLEAFLPGEEASMLVVMDGTAYRTLPPSQDHKRGLRRRRGAKHRGAWVRIAPLRWFPRPSIKRSSSASLNPCTLIFPGRKHPTAVCFSSG